MPLSKAEMSKRDLHRRQQEAASDGLHFAVRHSFDGKPYDPPRFFASLDEAGLEAEAIQLRINTADGADVHARPDDMKRSEVWIEQLSDGAWIVLDGTRRSGYFDTARRRDRIRTE